MKALIVDDEPLARARIQRLLASISQYTYIEQASNGQEALAQLTKQVPDIVFLDIDMPQMSGLEVAEKINQLPVPPAIIFVTAHPEHALDALQLAAAGYLVKPVTENDLVKVTEQLGRLTRAHIQKQKPQIISYQIGGELKTVELDSVIYVSAEDKYSRVVFDSGNALIEQSLKQLENMHPSHFLRVHRKTLINKSRIASLKKCKDNSHKVILTGCDDELEISRREYKKVKNALS